MKTGRTGFTRGPQSGSENVPRAQQVVGERGGGTRRRRAPLRGGSAPPPVAARGEGSNGDNEHHKGGGRGRGKGRSGSRPAVDQHMGGGRRGGWALIQIIDVERKVAGNDEGTAFYRPARHQLEDPPGHLGGAFGKVTRLGAFLGGTRGGLTRGVNLVGTPQQGQRAARVPSRQENRRHVPHACGVVEALVRGPALAPLRRSAVGGRVRHMRWDALEAAVEAGPVLCGWAARMEGGGCTR